MFAGGGGTGTDSLWTELIVSTTAGALGSTCGGLGTSVTEPPHNGQKGLSQSITLWQRVHFFILYLLFGRYGLGIRQFICKC
jgi:hypothetical protein